MVRGQLERGRQAGHDRAILHQERRGRGQESVEHVPEEGSRAELLHASDWIPPERSLEGEDLQVR